MNTNTVYRPDIDGLRAVAVIAVLVFHATPTVLLGGFNGVDMFFVISGYLITKIIVDDMNSNRFSFAVFYGKRIRRIFPALLIVVTATLIVGWWTLLQEEYASIAMHALAGIAYVSNILLLSETGYFDTAAEFKPFLHLWSLAIEEQFYLFWPAAIG